MEFRRVLFRSNATTMPSRIVRPTQSFHAVRPVAFAKRLAYLAPRSDNAAQFPEYTFTIMMTPISMQNIEDIRNPEFRFYARRYADIESRVIDTIESYGIEFDRDDGDRKSTRLNSSH